MLLKGGPKVAETNFSSSADLVVQGSALFALSGAGSRAGGHTISDPSLLTILELFCFTREKNKAFDVFRQAVAPANLKSASLLLDNLEKEEQVNCAQSNVTVAE